MSKALRMVLVKATAALEGSHESNHRGLTVFTTAAQPRIINQCLDLIKLIIIPQKHWCWC